MATAPDQILFDAELPPPYQRHSVTSKEAADSIKPDAGRLRALVLDTIRKHGPMTDEDIIDLTGLSPNTARPRRVELLDRGLIEAVGTHKTRSGRNAKTWAVKSDG